MRDTNSTEPVVIHIRMSRQSTSVDGKTLCNKWVMDQEVRKYLVGRRKTIDWHAMPEGLKYLSRPVLFSLSADSAHRVDEPNPYYNREMPDITPYNPPVKYWVFCEDCWDKSAYRSLRALAKTEL